MILCNSLCQQQQQSSPMLGAYMVSPAAASKHTPMSGAWMKPHPSCVCYLLCFCHSSSSLLGSNLWWNDMASGPKCCGWILPRHPAEQSKVASSQHQSAGQPQSNAIDKWSSRMQEQVSEACTVLQSSNECTSLCSCKLPGMHPGANVLTD